MKITKDLIKTLISQCIFLPGKKSSQDQIAEQLSDKIVELVEINRSINVIDNQLIEHRAKFDAISKELMQSKDNIQLKCPHTLTTYHSDPSGNGDSYYTCDVCNKIMTG